MNKYIPWLLILLLIGMACSHKPSLIEQVDQKYRAFLYMTQFVLDTTEIEQFIAMTDQQKQDYIMAFWQKTDPSPGTITNEFKDMLTRRIKEADDKFGYSRIRGSDTDRGRIYIIYGPPDRTDEESYDSIRERDITTMGQTRERDSDIASSARSAQKSYAYWTYTNRLGLKSNTTFTFVDDYSTGQFEMLTNIYSVQDPQTPNPLRLYLTEKGRTMLDITEESPSVATYRQGEKELQAKAMALREPAARGRMHVQIYLYLPLRSLVFVENETKKAVALVSYNLTDSAGHSLAGREQLKLKLPIKDLKNHLNNGYSLLFLPVVMDNQDATLVLNVTDERSKTQVTQELQIKKLTAQTGSAIKAGDLLLSVGDPGNIFVSETTALYRGSRLLVPSYGNMYTRADLLYASFRLDFTDGADRQVTQRIVMTPFAQDNTLAEKQQILSYQGAPLLITDALPVRELATGKYRIKLYIDDVLILEKPFYFLR